MPEGRSSSSSSRKSRRDKRRRKNRKREKLFYNLAWVLGGLAVGLPLLGAVLYLLSRGRASRSRRRLTLRSPPAKGAALRRTIAAFADSKTRITAARQPAR